MSNLALTLWQMEERRPALHLMQTAAEGRGRVLGWEHPDTLDSLRDVEHMQTALGLFSTTMIP